MSEASSSSADSAAPPPPQQEPKKKSKPWLQPITLPNAEQIMMQDIQNNCFVKTGISGLMGGVAGVAFGLFSASMENAHGVSNNHHSCTPPPFINTGYGGTD